MKVGVIGAGTMGQGIAKAFAQCEGYTVALCDIKQEWAENGKAKIAKGYERLVAKGKLTQEKVDAILAAITPGLKEDLCADCDLIVEAAFEDMKVKQTTFGRAGQDLQAGVHPIRISIPVHHRDRQGPVPSHDRHALLQPRRPHEADRGHRRRLHPRRDRRRHQEDLCRHRQDPGAGQRGPPALSSTAS